MNTIESLKLRIQGARSAFDYYVRLLSHTPGESRATLLAQAREALDIELKLQEELRAAFKTRG